jgi:hypothetical protein
MSELEDELRKLKPMRPSNGLSIRIELALADAGKLRNDVITPHRFRVNWVGLGLGVAAAAAFLTLARIDFHPATLNRVASISPGALQTRAAQSPNYQAIGLTQVVYSKRDEGLLFPAGSTRPVRRIRTSKHETLRWEDPDSGARLQVSYPAEEVTLIPVSGE